MKPRMGSAKRAANTEVRRICIMDSSEKLREASLPVFPKIGGGINRSLDRSLDQSILDVDMRLLQPRQLWSQRCDGKYSRYSRYWCDETSVSASIWGSGDDDILFCLVAKWNNNIPSIVPFFQFPRNLPLWMRDAFTTYRTSIGMTATVGQPATIAPCNPIVPNQCSTYWMKRAATCSTGRRLVFKAGRTIQE